MGLHVILLANQLGGLVWGRARIAQFLMIAALGGSSGYVLGMWARANEEPTEHHRGGRSDRQSEQETGGVPREDRMCDCRKNESGQSEAGDNNSCRSRSLYSGAG